MPLGSSILVRVRFVCLSLFMLKSNKINISVKRYGGFLRLFHSAGSLILIYNSAEGAEGGNVSASVNRTKENPLMGKIADQVHLLHKTYQEFPHVMPHSATQEEPFIQMNHSILNPRM